MYFQSLTNTTIVITGSSAGIGRAVAEECARRKANIALIARNEKRLQKIQQELTKKYKVSVTIHPLDVANARGVEKAAKSIEREMGPIDAWVNVAMVSVFSPVKLMQANEYKRVTEVTYLGYVYGTLSALRRMIERDKGVIVQVGSALAYRGIPLQSAYCAAKHAIQGFHDSLCAELYHDKSNVKVTMIQLPAHNTPQFDWVKSRLQKQAQPIPPIYQPEVAARAIVHLIQNPKRETMLGWSSVKAVWADKFFPSLADKYLANYGYEQQMTNKDDKKQENNLWQTVDKYVGSHGRFDDRAESHDLSQISHETISVGLGVTVMVLLIIALFL